MEAANSDDEYEYEETTVVAEIQGVMDAEFLADVKQAKILGIDGDKPLLQLDDYTFSGHYEDPMGTCMLFQDVTNKEDPDNRQKKLEYSCLSFKKLCLQSVFLKKNDDTVPEKSQEETVQESVPTETDKPANVDIGKQLDKNTDKAKNDSTNTTIDKDHTMDVASNSTSDQTAGTSNSLIDQTAGTSNSLIDQTAGTSITGTAGDPLDGT